MLKEEGFEISEVFTSGGMGTCIFVLYGFLCDALKKVFRRYPSWLFPNWMVAIRDRGYRRGDNKKRGYVIFVRATKNKSVSSIK